MAIYARLENGTYAEVTGVYKADGTEVTEIFQGDRLVYSASNEIYGSLPLYYNGKGYDLTDYLISGNAVQDGTPSPDAPVDVVGCGVRTGNLFNEVYPNIRTDIPEYKSIFVGDGEFTLSTSTDMFNNIANLFFLAGRVNSGAATTTNGVWKENPRTITSLDGYVTIAYRYYDDEKSDPSFNTAMLNTGSTALPYEPYGFKLPLTVNGTEYPIYLGQVESTRRVKKLVLTGEETIPNNDGASYNSETSTDRFVRDIPLSVGDNGTSEIILCTHLGFQAQSWAAKIKTGCCIYCSRNTMQLHLRFDNNTLGITQSDTNEQRTAKLKTYLAAQYAAGTPVTVWYVLAEPETAVVNEPLMKIGDYADTVSAAQAGVTIPTVNGANVLDMTSPVKPSEVYIKGKGIKPTGYGQLVDVNDVNILDKDGRPIYVHGQ